MGPELVAAAAGIILLVLEEWQIGKARTTLRGLRTNKRRADQAHEAIPEVAEKIDDLDAKIDERCDRLEDSVERNAEMVAYLHRDELGDDPLARQRLDVDLDDDLFAD